MEKELVKCEPKVPKTLANEKIQKSRIMKTNIKAISPEFIPTYAYSSDACCDLKANLPNGPLTVGTMQTVKIDTGIRIELPPGFEAQIRGRSGLSSKGIIVSNSPGTIDESFKGNLCVLLTNTTPYVYTINHLDKIAQMALKPVWIFDFVEVDTLNITERNEQGFGSTGT